MATIPRTSGLAKLVAEVRVQPTLSFYEKLIPFAMQFEQQFQHWRTDTLTLRFLDAKTRTAVALKHNQIILEVDLPDVLGFFTRFRQLLMGYLNLPHVSRILRAGVRGHFLVERGFAFEELVSICEDSLLIKAERRQTFLPGKMNDLPRPRHLLPAPDSWACPPR
jgi:hypothetical protein